MGKCGRKGKNEERETVNEKKIDQICYNQLDAKRSRETQGKKHDGTGRGAEYGFRITIKTP